MILYTRNLFRKSRYIKNTKCKSYLYARFTAEIIIENMEEEERR
jgi:hypothetical protein